MPVATLTSKGQVTIPAAVRQRLGLKTGDRVDFVLAPDGKVTLTPQRTPFENLRGILRSPRPRPVSVREMDEGIRRTVTTRWKRSGG
jgi:AbrB family looped-hinge helix DNA binding protein